MRRSNSQVALEIASTYQAVKQNVVRSLEEKGRDLSAEKLQTYLPYRAAREALRSHEAHLSNVRLRGVDVLKGAG